MARRDWEKVLANGWRGNLRNLRASQSIQTQLLTDHLNNYRESPSDRKTFLGGLVP